MSILDDITIHAVDHGNIAIMDNVAPDLFDNPVDPELLRAFLAAPTHWMVVAVLDGQVIGKCTAMVHLRPDKKDELYIDEIDVIAKWRQKGIAKAILAKILEMAKKSDCEQCWLGTEKDNIAAQRLYESNGTEAEEFLLYYLKF